MKFIKTYIAFLFTFFVIDMIWIAMFAGNFYTQQLGDLLKTTPDFSLVGIFYLCYAAAVIYLAVMNANGYKHSLLAGGILGALAYGTFTISNYTLIEGWTLLLVITDVLWGTFITAVSTLAAYYFYKPKEPY